MKVVAVVVALMFASPTHERCLGMYVPALKQLQLSSNSGPDLCLARYAEDLHTRGSSSGQ